MNAGALFLVASLLAAGGHSQEKEVTLLAVGDVMLSRHVAEAIRRHKDAAYPFAATRDLLHSPDILFGNLEGPITPGRPVKSGVMVFRADPGVESGLKDAGFTLLSLANNHIPDHGARGIRDTLAALDAVGIAHTGAGMDEDEARQPVILERGGLRFAFLAYNDWSVVPMRYEAARGHAGTNIVNVEHLKADIAAVRPRVDFVIVSMHHGWEYRKTNLYQIRFAHAAIDAGADLVIGHHPHVIQSVERYHGHFIAYSLGNFVFDQTFSDAVKQGAVLRASFTKEGLTSLQFIPIEIHDGAQPRVVTRRRAAAAILRRLETKLSPDGFVLRTDTASKEP